MHFSIVLQAHSNFCRRVLAAGCLVLGMASCTMPSKPIDIGASEQAQALWLQHQRQLQSYSQWSIKGRAALRSDRESWSATLTWQQYGNNYQVRLAGPFGQGAVNIDGSDEQIRVHIAGQEPVVADDAELLLVRNLGWSVPVQSLPFWLRGLPAPGAVDALILGESGTIEHLEQQGWQVDYSAYRPLHGINLPRKILIKNGELRLKLVLDRWRLGEEQVVAALR